MFCLLEVPVRVKEHQCLFNIQDEMFLRPGVYKAIFFVFDRIVSRQLQDNVGWGHVTLGSV